MYSGRLIDNLLESVERAEQHSFMMAELAWRKSVEAESGSRIHIYEQVVSRQQQPAATA